MTLTLVSRNHEKQLLLELKRDTIRLIKSCDNAEPIRRLLTCHDIIHLTLDINNRFPSKGENTPLICDVDALKDLRKVTADLAVCWWQFLPIPDFSPLYISKVDRLLGFYGLPTRF